MKMSLLGKVRQMFGFRSSESPTVVDEAIAKSRAVGDKADELNAVLRPYLDAPDPFKAFAVDIFERTQESNMTMHLGPKSE